MTTYFGHHNIKHKEHKKSYRIYANAVSIVDSEGVIFVCNDNHIWHRIHSQGIVISPIYRTDVKWKWSQVSLR